MCACVHACVRACACMLMFTCVLARVHKHAQVGRVANGFSGVHPSLHACGPCAKHQRRMKANKQAAPSVCSLVSRKTAAFLGSANVTKPNPRPSMTTMSDSSPLLAWKCVDQTGGTSTCNARVFLPPQRRLEYNAPFSLHCQTAGMHGR